MPSENVPVALNCIGVPRVVPGLAGRTATEESVAAVTVRLAEADMLPDTAVMVVMPGAREVTLPLLPARLLMVATDEADEPQVTEADMSWVVLSEKVPVALNG